MLVHLSKTSPYVCDISLGPIEQANRMASVPSKRLLPFLDIKESFPKRTPLKLLAAEEVPLDTSTITTASTTTSTEPSQSRQPSLQPVWYTEQTIVDENQEQPAHSACALLPTIESNSPEIDDEPITSLMHKSSTFTLEPEAALNESEKENDANVVITSTQKEVIHPTEPSEESFRALEHLLGLGSANNNNLTMTTTAQESPKSNHDTLSLTVVTPTELINNITATSLHMSYIPAGGGGGSLPSSQNVLLMPTIESITDPSINSTLPPPFSVDTSVSDEPSTSSEPILPPDQLNDTDNSFRFTDDDESRELNNYTSDSTEEESITTPPPPPPPPPTVTVRAPTSADVAYRALSKSRTNGRISQPVKVHSPLIQSDKTKSAARSSVPAALTRVLRSSTRRVSIKIPPPRTELVEMVTVPEEEEDLAEENVGGVTLNLTMTKEADSSVSPVSSEEADRSASSSEDVATPQEPLVPVLSREFTYNTPTTRVSTRRRSIITTRQSARRSYQSYVPPIPVTITEEEKESSSDNNNSPCSTESSNKSLLSSLSTNATVMSEAPPIILQKSLAGSASPSPNPTPVITIRHSERLSSNFSPRRSINPLHSSTPSIRSKSLQLVSIGEQEQVSTTVPPQLHIDSMHEDEEEPMEITAHDNNNNSVSMIDNEQQVEIPLRQMTSDGVQTSPERPAIRIDIAVQTTPSLDPSSRRHFQTMEQQTTPVIPRTAASSSCQTTPVPIIIRHSHLQQTSPEPEVVEIEPPPRPSHPPLPQQQITPMHSKAMIHLRRNVRFQFTPSTDARLTAKEKLEEEQLLTRGKQEIPIQHQMQDDDQPIVSDHEREDDTEDEVRKQPKTKKKSSSSKKKKNLPSSIKTDESSEEANESPILSAPQRNLSKDTTDDEQPKVHDTHVTSTTTKKKRSARTEKKSSPVPVPVPVPEPEIIVVTTTSPPPPSKRVNRKRPNPKTSMVPTIPPETISPTEPVLKRAKTNEVKQPLRAPSPEVPSTRSRSKTTSKTNASPEASTNKRTRKASAEASPVEAVPMPTTQKRTKGSTAAKKGKRRLHSVEQDEGLNTADEEEIITAQMTEPVAVSEPQVDSEEREKIEGLTVAELKTRLINHGETIPKGARKADLVALLMKIELQLLKERKEVETPAITTRKTRRKK